MISPSIRARKLAAELERIANSLYEESNDIGQDAPRPAPKMREFLEDCGSSIREIAKQLAE